MKILFLIVTSLLSIFNCYSQTNFNKIDDIASIEADYNLLFKPDSTSKAIEQDYQILLIGKKISKYESRGKKISDSLLAIFATLPFNQSSADFYIQQRNQLPKNKIKFTIYKSKQENIIRYCDQIGINDYFYDEPTTIFIWKLLPEKAVINGYSCQKATTYFAGRIWQAWFTRQLPFSDGPYKFCGLPGLIIKISDTGNNFSFELVKFKKLSGSLSLKLPGISQLTKTTKRDFLKGRENQRSNALSHLTSSGELSINKEQLQQLRRNNDARKYNPIEIKY